jgi:hypothetical protein
MSFAFLRSSTAVALSCTAMCLMVTPGHAEELNWRLPDIVAVPTSVPDTSSNGSGGWMMPPTSRRVNDASSRGIELPPVRLNQILFAGPTLVTTGFSGHVYGHPVLTEEERALARGKPEFEVIALDGAVVTLTDIEGYGHAPNGDEVTRTAEDRLFAREIGQVFGAVLDDSVYPNLYLSATSAFGLQIVGPDIDGDRLADRLIAGGPEAKWMKGQWGYAPQSGPGTIWRVDGQTGQIDVFANLLQDDMSNAAPSLGNLAYDAAHDRVFVSDLATGLITQFDLRGAVLDSFDHGVTARVAHGLSALPYDPAKRVEITDPAFNPLNPETWGFAPAARRVWGMTVQDDRLYYAVAAGVEDPPEVWSVGLNKVTGDIQNDARWELTPNDDLGLEISDLGFAPDGALVLAKRGNRYPSFDYSTFAKVGEAEVMRFVREAPGDDPATPSIWETQNDRYDVGFADKGNNTTGGLAFGPGYDEEGFLDFTQCRGTLWATGERLRDEAELSQELLPGGMLRVDGAMAQPVVLHRDDNSPPWISYSTDFNLTYPKAAQSGHIGDVVVLGCDGTQGASGDSGISGDGDLEGGCIGASCTWLACLRNPAECAPKPASCLQAAVELRCDRKTGTYVADVSQKGQFATALDRLKLTDPSGKIASLPREFATSESSVVDLTGLSAGQLGQIDICRYDAKAAADGVPYDCCNASVTFELPAQACVKETQ